MNPFLQVRPMNSTESDTHEEKREEGVDGSSTPQEQVHVSRRLDANSKRVFISIPRSDSSGDVFQERLLYLVGTSTAYCTQIPL